MTIAESVRKYREAYGLTQRQLADSLGVSTQFVSYLETGERRPSDSWIKMVRVPRLRSSLAAARIAEYRYVIAELKELVA